MIALFLLVTLTQSAAPQSAPRPNGVAVVGTVLDQSGGLVPGAMIQLIDGNGVAVQTTTTDAAGTFRLESVTAGTYELRAALEGFKTAATRIRVGSRSPSAQRLILEIAAVVQDVTVSSGGQVEATAAANLDAVAVDLNMLESLPVFDLDYVATVSRFLDSSAIGTGGVTLLVNGMEVSALRVSASAVQQIRINQDPYSAEYARPGRGRIEILTKPGSQSYEGELNLVARDARFDARNAFAATKPAERKTIAEGVFGGPLGRGRKPAFFLSGHDRRDDQQAVIFAVGPSGTIEDVVSQPDRESLLSGSVTWQRGDTTMSIRPNYQYESTGNRGAGGTTLASAASNFSHHEQQITYTQQTILRPTLLHQFQILFGHEREPTVSVSSQRGIVVAGAFTGGGAQADLVRTETHIQLTESLGWTHGRHNVRAGFQLPDWSRRGFDDRTNAGGTYFFSGLDAYAAGQPYAFTQQSGHGALSLLEKQVGVYIKDDYQLRPGLSLSLGLRYDWQNYFHDDNNLAPRASFAYAPGSRRTSVVRGGVGLFTDRSGPVVIADVLHSQPGGLVRYVITNPPYPDPSSALGAGAQPPSIVRLASDVQIPQTLQYGLSVDRQLRKSTTMSVAYTGTQGYHAFRSRDVNAPTPPLYAARPDAAFGVIRQVESTGRQRSDSMQVTVRGKITPWFSGQTQYTVSRADNDTNGIAAFPSNDYDLSGEWARADFDRRHRFLLLGRVSASRIVDVGVGLTMSSAAPYTAFSGDDLFHNGRGRARPAGVRRNSLEGAGYASLDLRASRDIAIGVPAKGRDGRTLSVALDAFNLLNRVNYGGFVGTIGSPLFGQPVSARAPRQLQLSARVKF